MSGDETSKLHERLDSAFAMMYYSCALRSSIVEDIYAEDFWKQASEFLSGWMPPNRKKLMGPLLNVSHRHMKMQVNQALALSRSDVYVTDVYVTECMPLRDTHVVLCLLLVSEIGVTGSMSTMSDINLELRQARS